MFTKYESRYYNSARQDEINIRAIEFWRQQGYFLTNSSAGQLQGQSYSQKIGLRREFYMITSPDEGGTRVDLHFKATVTDEGFIGGVISAIVFWPVTAVLGAVSYMEYNSDSRNMLAAYWETMDKFFGPTTQTPANEKNDPRINSDDKASNCKACHAPLPAEWKSCPYCGGTRVDVGSPDNVKDKARSKDNSEKKKDS